MKANTIIAIILIAICSIGVYLCVKEFIGEDRNTIENANDKQMEAIQFYGTHYFSHQTWADNYEETKNKEELKLYTGSIKESYIAKDKELIHFVEYEKGTFLVQDRDKKV